ncbi:HAD-IA family hydrolase [Candidatus Nitrosopelagicus sp.]|nr:HAD-IA family hydrolase [Candidatus Nitrosopelagicus sp.]
MKTFEEKLKNIKLIAFDLDNTLYDETMYFKFSFKIITPYLKTEFNVDPKKCEKKLWEILKKNGKHYHHLFDDLLIEYDIKPENLQKLLFLFESVKTKLSLFPNVRNLLIQLKKKYQLSMITSGIQDVQRNKINLLDIQDYFEPIIYSSTLKHDKPDETPFRQLIKLTGIDAENIVYVGDNPFDDFLGPNNLGITTIRVYNSDFKNTKIDSQKDAKIKLDNITKIEKFFL